MLAGWWSPQLGLVISSSPACLAACICVPLLHSGLAPGRSGPLGGASLTTHPSVALCVQPGGDNGPDFSDCARKVLAAKPKKGNAVLFHSIKPSGE